MPGIPVNLTRSARQGAWPRAASGRHNGKITVRPVAGAARQDAAAASRSARRLSHPRHGDVRRRALLRLAAVGAWRRCHQGRAADRRSVPRHRLHLQSRHAQRRHGPAERRRARSLLRDGQDQRRRHRLAAARRDEKARHRLREAGFAEGRRHHRVAVGLWRRRTAVATARRRHGAAGDERHDDDARPATTIRSPTPSPSST